jgi:hypothetical protein
MLDAEDPQEVMGRRELYRRFSRMSETLIELPTVSGMPR